MMSDTKLQRLIERCDEAFVTAKAEKDVVEPGLYAEWLNADQLQIKKACRLLALAKHLMDEKTPIGSQQYYTTVIESSFVAIERTIQAYLLSAKVIRDDEFVTHENIFEMGAKAGIYSKTTEEMLRRLWDLNRSNIYYRRGLSTKYAAENMYLLANSIHTHLLSLDKNLKKECVC